MFNCPLQPGETISNRRLMDIFHCACEGGIRYASKTNTIVLVVNNTKDGLPNTWKNDILEFSGRPLKKPGTLSAANHRLHQFLSTHGDIFLFMVDKPGQYQFIGRAEPAGPMRLCTSQDITWPIFPLKIIKCDSPQ